MTELVWIHARFLCPTIDQVRGWLASNGWQLDPTAVVRASEIWVRNGTMGSVSRFFNAVSVPSLDEDDSWPMCVQLVLEDIVHVIRHKEAFHVVMEMLGFKAGQEAALFLDCNALLEAPQVEAPPLDAL